MLLGATQLRHDAEEKESQESFKTGSLKRTERTSKTLLSYPGISR